MKNHSLYTKHFDAKKGEYVIALCTYTNHWKEVRKIDYQDLIIDEVWNDKPCLNEEAGIFCL